MFQNNRSNKVQIVRHDKDGGSFKVLSDPKQVAESMMHDFNVSNMVASRDVLHVCFGDVIQNVHVSYYLHDHTTDARIFIFGLSESELNIIGQYDRLEFSNIWKKVVGQLLEALKDALKMGDTYCDWCETHSIKPVDAAGNWDGHDAGPINHKPDCIVGIAEHMIAKVR